MLYGKGEAFILTVFLKRVAYRTQFVKSPWEDDSNKVNCIRSWHGDDFMWTHTLGKHTLILAEVCSCTHTESQGGKLIVSVGWHLRCSLVDSHCGEQDVALGLWIASECAAWGRSASELTKCSYSRMLFSHKKEWSIDTCCHADEP